MGATIFTSTIAHCLKDTLEMINMDKTDGLEAMGTTKKWAQIGTMSDAYEDHMDFAGPGLFAEKAEGEEIEADTVREGPITRYIPRTFAKKLLITEEAIEDAKYKEVTDMARMLKRAGFMTFEYDCTNILARGANSNYVGADDQPLWSTSHTLINGGTASNRLGTYMSPSTTALQVAVTQIMNWPSLDGFVQMDIVPKKIVFPNAQWGAWATILKSSMDPSAGNFSAINVAKSELDIEAVRVPFWQNTTLDWAIFTNVDNGVQVLWRRKWRGRTWVHEDNEVMVTSRSGRWARGWTNWRHTLGVVAT